MFLLHRGTLLSHGRALLLHRRALLSYGRALLSHRRTSLSHERALVAMLLHYLKQEDNSKIDSLGLEA